MPNVNSPTASSGSGVEMVVAAGRVPAAVAVKAAVVLAPVAAAAAVVSVEQQGGAALVVARVALS